MVSINVDWSQNGENSMWLDISVHIKYGIYIMYISFFGGGKNHTNDSTKQKEKEEERKKKKTFEK